MLSCVFVDTKAIVVAPFEWKTFDLDCLCLIASKVHLYRQRLYEHKPLSGDKRIVFQLRQTIFGSEITRISPFENKILVPNSYTARACQPLDTFLIINTYLPYPSLTNDPIHEQPQKMCQAQSITFSECGHIIEYKLDSRCPEWSWWAPCPAWNTDTLPQIRNTDRPYCRDCYLAKVASMKKKCTIHEAKVIKEGNDRGWSVEKTWQARMIVRGEMEGAVRELNEMCLGKGR